MNEEYNEEEIEDKRVRQGIFTNNRRDFWADGGVQSKKGLYNKFLERSEEVVAGEPDGLRKCVPTSKAFAGEVGQSEYKGGAGADQNVVNDIMQKAVDNPLAQVEELEEGNYNMIDGIINNSPKEEKNERRDVRGKIDYLKGVSIEKHGRRDQTVEKGLTAKMQERTNL